MKTFDGSWGAKSAAESIGNADGIVLSDTVWDDLAMPLIGKKLDAAAGKADYDWENLEVKFAADGDITVLRDVVGFPLQKMHGIKIDSDAKLHIHWTQTDAVAREITVRYRLQENGSDHMTNWYEVACPLNSITNAFPYTSGSINQVTDLCDIAWSGMGISTTAQIKFTRTDSVAGTISAVFVDAHVEYDAMGSSEEWVKYSGMYE